MVEFVRGATSKPPLDVLDGNQTSMLDTVHVKFAAERNMGAGKEAGHAVLSCLLAAVGFPACSLAFKH